MAPSDPEEKANNMPVSEKDNVVGAFWLLYNAPPAVKTATTSRRLSLSRHMDHLETSKLSSPFVPLSDIQIV